MGPSNRDKWSTLRPRSTGAAIGAILFEVAKAGFNFYVSNALMRPYARIYGAVALIPVFLIWIFVAWTVVLFGAEVAYIHQQLRRILYERGVVTVRGLRPALRFLLAGEQTALRVLGLVGRSFALGRGPVADVDLARRTGTTLDVIQAVLGRLCDMHVIQREEGEEAPAYAPALPLDEIRLDEVLVRYRGEANPPGVSAVPVIGWPGRAELPAAQAGVAAAPERGAPSAGEEDDGLSRADALMRAIQDATSGMVLDYTLADLVEFDVPAPFPKDE